MSESRPDAVPECGNPDCPYMTIKWVDGKRVIEKKGEYIPFAVYVEKVLAELLGDMDAIKEHLGVTRSGLVP